MALQASIQATTVGTDLQPAPSLTGSSGPFLVTCVCRGVEWGGVSQIFFKPVHFRLVWKHGVKI